MALALCVLVVGQTTQAQVVLVVVVTERRTTVVAVQVSLVRGTQVAQLRQGQAQATKRQAAVAVLVQLAQRRQTPQQGQVLTVAQVSRRQ
jgi:hypothetical protein